MSGRLTVALEYSFEALQLARNEGFRLLAINVARCIGIAEWKRGKLGTAMAQANESRKTAIALGNGYEEWFSSLLVGMIHLHSGKYSDAASCFTSESDWLIPRENSRASLLTTEFLGDVHLEQEQSEEALKHYDEVWPKALALVPKGDIVAELRRRRAECYLLLNQFPTAYEEAQTGLQHCRELGDRYEEAATYRVLALAAAAIGKPDEAKQWFDQGFAYYEDIETPFEWGKLWMSYGDWLAGPYSGAHADKRAALDAYRAAEEHFERMGAEGKLAMARARIETLSNALGSASAGSERTLRDRLRAPRRPRITAELERRASWAHEAFGMVTRNRALLDTLAQCARLAEGNLPILVLGESGTGKELIAQGIHRLSSRRGQYLPLNCSAIPHEVFESELFGHVAGAFTGATRDKAGIFEVCDGGTVFLDEIGELPLELQARLLRYLESGEFRRVGSSRNLRADTRLIAATNRDRSSLKSGQGFRTDLYYRLAHAVVTLPPLRQRGDDVELLVGHFLERAAEGARKAVFLSDEAWSKLIDHPWPGNIRELRSTLQRIVLLATAGAEVLADGFELDDTDVPTNLAEETVLVEKRRIEDALQKAAGNKSEAARLLGLSRTTMLSKMKRYGMAD
jgi:DNA-binding NtrC family response regulator